ncbi:MAG TPA: NUDIX hydrolase [Chloroflexia bacterium]|jgi:ADP-ribose pyrophosphatase YjhB (NUDIX family)
MLEYKYCPVCASELQELQLATEDRPRLVCAACGHVFYINPKVVSGTLPIEDGKVWLLRRGIEPRAGFWTHPAGYQEWDETSEEAAIRETREEIGCEVVLDRLLGVYSRAQAPVVNIIYIASFADPSQRPRLTPEAVQVAAFAPDDIPWDELAFISTERALRDWVSSLTSAGKLRGTG